MGLFYLPIFGKWLYFCKQKCNRAGVPQFLYCVFTPPAFCSVYQMYIRICIKFVTIQVSPYVLVKFFIVSSYIFYVETEFKSKLRPVCFICAYNIFVRGIFFKLSVWLELHICKNHHMSVRLYVLPTWSYSPIHLYGLLFSSIHAYLYVQVRVCVCVYSLPYKRPIHSQSNWAILLHEVIPDEKTK
jgi:hypothetical protein